MGVRVEFHTKGLVPEEQYIANANTNMAGGYASLEQTEPHDRPLAVVGGGPSVHEHLADLRDWPGDIWAVNQSASFLTPLTTAPVSLFTVDPDPVLAGTDFTQGVRLAILGSSCAPELFAALKAQGADIRMFHTHQADEYVGELNIGGPSSVTRTFLPAAWLGYKKVVFFGCEGSFTQNVTHAYRAEDRPRQLVVRAGERDYVTTPDLYLTTQYLANVIRDYSEGLSERSGGLLRAMLEHPDTWEVVAYSKELRDQLDPEAHVPYQVAA